MVAPGLLKKATAFLTEIAKSCLQFSQPCHLIFCHRIQVCGYEVAVCPLPGNRMGGARRSLVADLGKKRGNLFLHAI